MFEPIAIIGMGMRLPGGVCNATDYWDLLVNGKSGRCRVPSSRYNVDTWYGPGRPNHVPTGFGYFLQDINLGHVDPSFWSFTKQEAELMDPRQRLFLEVAYEALESSGTTNFRGSDVGVYVGTMGEEWNHIESKDQQNLHQVRPDVYGDYIIANRTSYEFDFTGPSVVLRTACSASLVALHMACRDLQGGDCASALVGGVNLILTPKDTAVMHQQGVLSLTASCKSFDADADGFARGEGVTAIYIKKLSDAVRDGDPIRAVIRSTCIAGDGRTQGLTTPNPKSHEKLMRRGHQLAGISDLSKTAMVECHGTGTTVGDPLEANAIANIWSEHGIHIGSVKPNIGHGEGASGLSSVIKMVLALENSTIPPNINFKTPNPKILWGNAKLKVPTEPLPWPADKLERASVNSFGIGGSNAHVLLESAACFGVSSARSIENDDLSPKASKHHLLVFSAGHPDSVKRTAANIKQYLSQQPDKIRDVAYSLSSRRELHQHRAFCVTDGVQELHMSHINKPGKLSPSLIWVFTGQGAQWAQMGKELVEQEPLFRQKINSLDGVLANLPCPPSWTIKGLLLAPKSESRLDEAEFSQPCLVAIQVALVDLLRSWGVAPSAVVGHSSGETAAAYASGAITAEDAIRIAYHRGQITRLIKSSHKGSMAAIGLGRGQVEHLLKPGVIIGCENSPANVTLSGEADVLETVMEDIKKAYPEVLVRSLRVECGYHSHHMKTAAADFTRRLEGLFQPKLPNVPFYSSVTGKMNEDMSSSYWVRNVVSPVLFSTAAESVLDDFKSPIFMEIGPHSALAGPLRQILQARNRNAEYISTLVRNQNAVSCVMKTAGELWVAGATIDLSAVVPRGEFLADLPTYPWHYEKEFWVETRLSRSWRFRKHAHHELLGTRVEEIADACPAWRCNLRVEDVPWLREHTVFGETVFPATGFISMIGEALKQLTGSIDYTIKHIRFDSALVLHDQPVELVTILNPSHVNSEADSGWFDLSIHSLSYGCNTWVKHVTGHCKSGSDRERQALKAIALPRKASAAPFYSTWKRFGLSYGPRFQNLTDINAHVSDGTAIATLQSELSEYEKSSYTIHPTLLDSSMHFSMIASCRGLVKNHKSLAVPTFIEELYIGKPSGQIQVKATTNLGNAAKETSQVVGVSEGQVVIDIQGLEVEAIGDSSLDHDTDPHAGVVLEWKPDIDLLDLSHILRHREFGLCSDNLNKMVLACVVESRAQLQFLPATKPHLVRFKGWLDESYRKAMTGNYLDVLNAFEIATMSTESRQTIISEMLQACKGTPSESHALAVYEVYTNVAAWFSGNLDTSKPTSKHQITAQASGFLCDVDITSLLQLLVHKRSRLNILQIGGVPEDMLPSWLFAAKHNHDVHSTYTYTTASAQIDSTVKQRLAEIPTARHVQLDINVDPVSQGLNEESFDLILKIEPTPISLAAARNMRKLLKPTGRLVLQHANPTSRTLQYVFGLSHNPNVLYEGWAEDLALYDHLSQAGFDNNGATTYSGDHARLTIVTPYLDHWKATAASIICQDPSHHSIKDATRALKARGFDLDFVTPGQEVPWGQPAVCLLDLEGPFLHNMTPQQWTDLKTTIFSAQDEKLLWVTGASQIDCKDPNYSLILGTARSLRRELSMDIVTLELDSFDANGWNAMNKVLETLGQRFTGGEVEPESEYVFSQGSLQICRFRPINISEQLYQGGNNLSKQLKISKPGVLNSLRWEAIEPVPLERDLIEVETKAIGLNVRDMEISKGDNLEQHAGCSDFGFEGSGIVRRVGSEVRRFRPGDRVAFTFGGCLSTSITLPETMCVEIPGAMSFEEAASSPYSYGTALYGLMELGKLRRNQAVLIHSACDALGLAAIQLAQTVGAEIFCKVEHADQAEYLNRSYGIPKSHILSGDDASSAFEVLRLSNNQGVDVMFGPIAKDSLGLYWKCLATSGIVIQTRHGGSSRGFYFNMPQPSSNQAFVSLDQEELRMHRPSECTRLIEQAFMFCKLGLNHPPQPITSFEAARVVEAFQYLQEKRHIGRVVVRMPECNENLLSAPLRANMNLHPDRTYVFVGGFGGLGQATARYLAEHGARHLIFFSRSAEESAVEFPEYVEELQALGCTVQAISGSVDEIADVMKVVSSARTPIAGVLQAAMVLQDINITDMTFDQWQKTVKPKVQGTWNLHHALQSQSEPLDFFFLFSSLSGLGGQIGQANYAAGNAFLDAFVQYRHTQGLACSVLDIGIMEDIGVLARDQNRLEALRATSQHCLHEQDFLDALELMIKRSHKKPADKTLPYEISEGCTNHSQVAIGMRSSASKNRTGWQRDPRTVFLGNSSVTDQNDHMTEPNRTLKEFLQACSSDPAQLQSEEGKLFLAKQISGALQDFTMHKHDEVDLSLPLQTDSLVTVELRNWLRQKMGVTFTILELRSAESIASLGREAAVRLFATHKMGF
ncbi:Lovastatin diketide synthase LovF 1 [Colletotrichum truncatum]|uniref:Lovastatin diketide synthase LovF 1 n=1 Tax=Colletotrichum truncatum TaxID=5467 RepID=A0ACC3YNC2_COLTU